MNILLRDARAGDETQVVRLFRDSYGTLRKSLGGAHPDEAVDRVLSLPDEELFEIYLSHGKMIIAEVDGELAGFSSFTSGRFDRLLQSSYFNLIYVKASFQGGKGGVSVGRLLNESRLRTVKEMGFRKVYGYASPESVGFESKFGARYYPAHDRYFPFDGTTYKYYEVELRPSALNRIPVEALLFGLFVHWSSFRHGLSKRLMRVK
ncbi:MAG: hypothetical protein AB1529_00810 [Candidatus Micrarchaeota archaeon]